MHIERFELPGSGYGSKTATLTAYVQGNVQAQEERLRPAVVICPGGGYEFCSDREAEPVALAFAARGFQAFVLDYTVLDADEMERGEALLPAPQRDLAWAVALVRAHAEEWAVDAGRIAVLGFSAGAHLCAVYSGLCRHEGFARGLGLSRGDIAVVAQVLCYPVIDFSAGWPADGGRVAPICGDAELCAAQGMVDAGTPRTFLWHTAADAGVPVRNSYRYAAALAEAGVDHECHVFHEGPHGMSLATRESAKDERGIDAHVARWLDLAVEWLAG